MEKAKQFKELMSIPGVGKSIAKDLWDIGIREVGDLKESDPEELYNLSNRYVGTVQDRCLLYVFRCAVYFANTRGKRHVPEKLKWWNWESKESDKVTRGQGYLPASCSLVPL